MACSTLRIPSPFSGAGTGAQILSKSRARKVRTLVECRQNAPSPNNEKHDCIHIQYRSKWGPSLTTHTFTSTRFFSSGTLDLRASCNTAMACGIRMRVIASPAGTPPGAPRNAALAPHSMSESMASLAPHSRSPGLRGLGVRPFSSLPNSHCSVMFTSHASCGAIPQWARTAARRISLATL